MFYCKNFKKFSLYFFTICCCIFLSGCAFFQNIVNKSEYQQQSVEEKLNEFDFDELHIACDGCNFFARESIEHENSLINEGQIGGSRSQSGVRAYFFEKMEIDQAFLLLLDSNIFAQGMNRGLRLELMESIVANKSDFAQQGEVQHGTTNIFASLSYAKRLNNEPSLPRAMLDSVEIIQDIDGSSHYASSLEGYILQDEIVIFHFFTESQTWRRR